MMHTQTHSPSAARSMRRALGLGVVALCFSGCSNLLNVDNPNNVSSGALDVPEAAPAIVNGAINTAANAISSMLNAYTITSDETYQVGSRDDYRLLDTGLLDNNTNEYTQSGYLKGVRARWMAEQAIQKVGKFKADGKLPDLQVLVNAYLMGAVMYDAFGNWYDDTPISDRTISGANLGEDKMVQVFDSALKWLDLAAPIAKGDNLANVLGMRSRVKFDRAIWLKLNPPGTTPANPLVNDAGATADATAAIAAMNGDYTFDLLNDGLNSGDDASGGVGFEMNSRLEHTPSQELANIDPTNNKPTAVIAKDPVTGLVDATAKHVMERFMFAEDINHPPLTQVSKREMLLLLAEAALAGGNNAGFDSYINTLRDMDGKAAYTGAGPTRLELLIWERRVNLVFQGRRLNDMYRFGIKDPRWIASSVAVRKPGCELPIPLIELESNKKISGGAAHVVVCK